MTFRFIINPGHVHIEPIDDPTPTSQLFSYTRPRDPLLSRTYPRYCDACGDPKDNTPAALCLSCTRSFHDTRLPLPPDHPEPPTLPISGGSCRLDSREIYDTPLTQSPDTTIRFMPSLPHHCLACGQEIGEDGNAQGLCDSCMNNFG